MSTTTCSEYIHIHNNRGVFVITIVVCRRITTAAVHASRRKTLDHSSTTHLTALVGSAGGAKLKVQLKRKSVYSRSGAGFLLSFLILRRTRRQKRVQGPNCRTKRGNKITDSQQCRTVYPRTSMVLSVHGNTQPPLYLSHGCYGEKNEKKNIPGTREYK